MLYIFVIVIRSILVDMQKAYLLSPLFVVWLSLQAQSLISVDSVSLTVWTWIFSGALIAICVEQPIEEKRLRKDIKTTSRAPSKYVRVSAATLTIIGVSLSVLPPIGQIAYRSAFIEIFDPASSQSVKLKAVSLINSEKKDSRNATWPRYSAQLLYANGAYLEASQAAKRVLILDKNDYVGWWYLASSLEKLSQRKAALQAREMTVKLDPLNPANLLEYSLDLAESGEVELSQEISNQIVRNYPGTVEAKTISDSQTK
jgi:tetratricopeptide (TPR) repeat protein